MTNMDALFMAALALLFVVYEYGVGKLRCGYCGEVSGHDDHCPYQGGD